MHLLVKFPDADSPRYHVSTAINSMTGHTELKFEDKGAISWNLITNAPLQMKEPTMIALRVEGYPGVEGATLRETFEKNRANGALRIIAFFVRIEEAGL